MSAATLIRTAEPAPVAMPGLDRVGTRLARALGTALSTMIRVPCAVTPQAPAFVAFESWRGELSAFAAIARYKMRPLKVSMLVGLPPAMVGAMLDRFYGGDGAASARSSFSRAERQFFARLTDLCADKAAAAWAEIMPLAPALAGHEFDARAVSLGAAIDQVVVQTFDVAIDSGVTDTLSFIYPAAALRGVPALTEAEADDEDAVADPAWQARLTEAVLQARLPVRTVLARPEMPLSKLLGLRTGDIIPVCLPARVPMTVAGRRFAEGTIGEANGRAAFKIDHIEQGIIDHE